MKKATPKEIDDRARAIATEQGQKPPELTREEESKIQFELGFKTGVAFEHARLVGKTDLFWYLWNKGIKEIEETLERHAAAFPKETSNPPKL